MFKRFTLRSVAVMSYIFVGLFALLVFIADYFSLSEMFPSWLPTAMMVVSIVWCVPSLVISVRESDEMSRAIESQVAMATFRIMMLTLVLIFAAVTLADWEVSAADATVLALAVLFLSYGIVFLVKLGRKDADLED